jgi:hypothetical protein
MRFAFWQKEYQMHFTPLDMQVKRQKINLNKNEYIYLCKASFLIVTLQRLLVSTSSQDDTYSLKISEQQADEIRDIFGEQLQLVGFDEKYKLTHEGSILEYLIDKFFFG